MADEQLTLDTLLTVADQDTILATLLARMQGAGVPVTDWLAGAVLLTLAEKTAISIADLTALVPIIARNGYVFLSDSIDWLSLLAESAYGLTRQPATFAIIHMQLTNASGTPYTITPGQLWMVEDPDVEGLRWNSTNTTNQSLASGGGTLVLDFRAEFAGPGYNILFGSPPDFALATPLPGVTLAPLEVVDGDAVPLGTFMVTVGTEAETLVELQNRCRVQWGTLAFAGPAISYEAWALDAAPAVRRVLIDDSNPDGPGTVDVYLAGQTGGVGGADVAAVDAVIQVRKPPTAIVTVQTAADLVVTFAATVACDVGFQTQARGEIFNALTVLIEQVAIGDGAGGGTLRYSDVVAALNDATGVQYVVMATLLLNGVASDVAPALGEVVTWDPADVSESMPGLTFL